MMSKASMRKKSVRRKLKLLQRDALEQGISLKQLRELYFSPSDPVIKSTKIWFIVAVITVLISIVISGSWLYSVLGERCLVASNFLVWEASRPLADCSYCSNVTKPIVLWNVTRRGFAKYAYSSKPIIIKNSIQNWRATKEFSYEFFKRLYENTEGSYDSLEDGCQFLNFKSDLFTLKEVFKMSAARASNEPGQDPWYVGWGNCHPDILAKVRQYYDVPNFLPDTAEFPATENIFFGYEIGAVMHLDYISRLMWQGQVKGSKFWSVAPVPECDHVCHKFGFYVEAGDVVLLDTRIWYHSTKIPKGQFSLTVQSEYG